ncbi:Fe2+-dependent dioxygenase [Parasphingorhabdus sp.]|jgi:PKHD-type hydroxylase|uniref:Fe2+-dependent dioxygenase n=1 Tax=Parasphingorhabdus sp. TaxID=2709688 RepID=UPI003001FE8D
MLLAIPDILSPEQALAMRAELEAAEWVDGNVTSGSGSASVKRNRQLPEQAPVTQAAQARISDALMANAIFLSAALPHTVFPPLFNRYGGGETFGLHVDNSIRFHGPSGARIRTDLSATLFLTDPEDYDGGELEIEDHGGTMRYKLPSGHMLLYPSTSLHQVTPVTRGDRISCFFWLQSLVADPGERELLFDLDQTVQTLSSERGKADPEVLRLTQIYHNLVRKLAQV